MKKNGSKVHRKVNWLKDFACIVHCHPRFGEVSKLVEKDEFTEALRLLDSLDYTYSGNALYQSLRNGLCLLVQD